MSLVAQGREVFGFPVGGLGVLGRRTLCGSGSEGGVFAAFCLPSSSFTITGPPSKLLPQFRQEVSSSCGGCGFAEQVCDRTGILRVWLLQPFIYYSQGHGWLEACYRSLSPQPLYPTMSLSYGDLSVGPPVLAHRGLDGFYRPSGPSGSNPSRVSQVSLVLHWPSDIPISDPLLRSVIRAAGFYTCHSPNLLNYASLWIQDPTLYRRLARPWILSPGDCAGERLFVVTLRRTRSYGQSLSSVMPTWTIDYLGMALQSTTLKASPTQARIQKVLSLVAEFSSSREQPLSLWWSLLGVMSSMTSLILGVRLRMRSLQLRLNVAGPQSADHALISWDDSCHRDLWWWFNASHLVGGGGVSRSPSATPLHGCVRLWVGGFLRRRLSIRLVDSGHISLLHQPSRVTKG